MAYSEIYATKAAGALETATVSTAELVAKLINAGYTIYSVSEEGVTGITLTPAEVTLVKGISERETATVIVGTESGTNTDYYAEIKSKYYKLDVNTLTGQITLGDELSDLPDGVITGEVIVNPKTYSGGLTVTTANNGTPSIELGLSNFATTTVAQTITVSYAGKTATASVTIKESTSINAMVAEECKNPDDMGNVTISGTSPFEQGTTVTITPTPTSGYVFQKWKDDANNEYIIGGTYEGITVGTDGVLTYTVGTTDKIFTVYFDEKPIPITANDIATATNKADYYGKSVAYSGYTASYSSGWKIFHATSDNIYLIASTVAEKCGLKTGYTDSENVTTEYTGATISTANNTTTVTGDFADLTNFPAIMDGWLSLTYTLEDGIKVPNSNDNMKATEWLLDNRVWSKYSSDNAKWAIGSTTFELFVASYNLYWGDDVSALNVKSSGYNIPIGMWDNATSFYGIYSKPVWLACPSDFYISGSNTWIEGKSVHYIETNGGKDSLGRNPYTGGINVRPVICLNSNVQLTWNKTTSSYDISTIPSE